MSPEETLIPALRARPRPRRGSVTSRTRNAAVRANSATTSDVLSLDPLSTMTSSHGPGDFTAVKHMRHRRRASLRFLVDTTTDTSIAVGIQNLLYVPARGPQLFRRRGDTPLG